MFSSPWACSRCLGRLLRLALRPQRRLQSTTSDAVLSPVLLSRARSVAAEHARLSAQNAENYDVTIARKVGELGPVTAALKDWDDAQNSLHELQSLLSDPLSDAELRSLALTDQTITRASLPGLGSTLKRALLPPHPFAHLPALLEIHPGAGGSEASLFAADLLRMYTLLCTRLSLPTTLLSYSPDDSVPASTPALTSAVLEVSSPAAYSLLRSESGVHRVQRVPATEKKGRTHTSAASVLILPSLPASDTSDSSLNSADPKSDYYIAPDSVRSETMRASGAGGQHVNKTNSAIRLTHEPTGIVVAMQESRSQHSNRERAWQVLRAKVAEVRRREREEQVVRLRRKAMGGVGRMGREDKVRTYNFSQNRVSDHRCGWETGDLEGVLGGGVVLEEGMQRVREWMDEEEVKGLIAEAEDREAK